MSDGVVVRRPRTVAVIEDDPDICWLLEELAQDAGFEVQMYATYDEALMRLATDPVNAIIADCIDCGYITPTESDGARLAELAGHAPIILHTVRPWAKDATYARYWTWTR
jgi:DNA-binding NtrC family response regulator